MTESHTTENDDHVHVWRMTGNSKDGDAGRGGQSICAKCDTQRWFWSKGPCLALMMRKAYNAFIGSDDYSPVPDAEVQNWLAAVKAVIETPQLIVTLEKGDTIHAYPEGVISAVEAKRRRG